MISEELLADGAGENRADSYGLLSAGRYGEALEPLHVMLDRARAAGDAQAEAAAAHDLGVAYLGQGAVVQAADHFEAAIELSDRIGDTALKASALDNIGTLFAGQPNQSERAALSYDQAIALAEDGDHRRLAFNALTNRARLDLDAGRQPEARERLARAEAHLTAGRDQAGGIDDILLLGRLWMHADNIEAAYDAFIDASERAAAAEQPRSEALAAGYLGDLYAGSERHDDAILLYDQAAFLAQTADAPDLIYRWQWQTGRLLAKTDEIDRAIDTYRRAVTALDRLRPTLIEAGTGFARNVDLRAPYVELADLMLRRAAGTPEKTAKQRDLEEARQTIERYRNTELTDYFRDECVTDFLATIEPIDGLAPKTAVLYPIMMADRLVILLSLADKLEQRSVPIGADRLTEKIDDFRTLLEKRTTNQFLRPAQELYDLILRPLEPTLSAAAIHTLIIVPDEGLRTVPISALHDGEQFVVDRYALATVPSLRLIEPKPFSELELQPLLSGLSEAVQGFPALPFVESELSTIGALIGGNILSDQSFVADEVRQSLSAVPHSVVHIAWHAQFTGDPKESFILTYDGRLNMDSLERFIKQSRFREQPVELLTLSACQTAVGDDRAALGLAGLAVKSGARSALASLWHINDQASSLLIADFYEKLRDRPEIGKAKALQLAQIKTKEDLRYRHPAYWAPMIMIGNWL